MSNKSKTPRTDTIRDMINCDSLSDHFSTWYGFAQQLEQEINYQKNLTDEACQRLIKEHDDAVQLRIILKNNMWQKIETAPKDSTVIDIWSASEGRLTNYRRVKLSDDNIFYNPDESGICCIRDATYWMPIPNPPMALKKENK